MEKKGKDFQIHNITSLENKEFNYDKNIINFACHYFIILKAFSEVLITILLGKRNYSLTRNFFLNIKATIDVPIEVANQYKDTLFYMGIFQ
jgi:hypothetical protein